MGEFSLFWPTGTTGDGTSTYTDSQLFAWLRRTFNSDMAADRGPLTGYNGELAVTAGTGKVTVATGAAYVYGIPYELDAALDVTIPTPTANTRVDRIVLRADWTAKMVRVTRIAGTEGAGAPAITQNPGSVYEVKLAQVSVTTGGVITVTDERQFCRFASEAAAENIADGAVTTSKLANAAVTAGKIAGGSGSGVDADLLDGQHASAFASASHNHDAAYVNEGQTNSITTTMLQDGAVTAAKIADRARSFFVPAVYPRDETGSAYLAWGGVDDPGWIMPDSKKCSGCGAFRVPPDYASGLEMYAIVYAQATGNAYCENVFRVVRPGETVPHDGETTGYGAIPLTNGVLTEIQQLVPNSPEKGEYVTLRFTRDATNAADTVNNSMRFLGWLVVYTADS